MNGYDAPIPSPWTCRDVALAGLAAVVLAGAAGAVLAVAGYCAAVAMPYLVSALRWSGAMVLGFADLQPDAKAPLEVCWGLMVWMIGLIFCGRVAIFVWDEIKPPTALAFACHWRLIVASVVAMPAAFGFALVWAINAVAGVGKMLGGP